MVVSGINAGSNLGDDTVYSGTVAGAREGSMYGIPAVAFSLRYGPAMDFPFWADQAETLCRRLLASPLPSGIFLNVNFPDGPPQGIRTTRLSRKFARSSIYENDDPRGMKYYWIGEDESSWDQADDTDFWAVTRGFISVTPLHRDQTSYDLIEAVRDLYERD
jgi:5'-nucleotidase